MLFSSRLYSEKLEITAIGKPKLKLNVQQIIKPRKEKNFVAAFSDSIYF